MEWIGIGFLLALGAWLFTMVLDWFRRHPAVVTNILLVAFGLVTLAIVALAFGYSKWTGVIALVTVSRALWEWADRRPITEAPAESSPPSA